MANQHTVKKDAAVDPAFAHALPGPTNEELFEKQAELDRLRAEKGFPKVEITRDAKDKAKMARNAGVKLDSQEAQLPAINPDHDKSFDEWADLEHDPLGMMDPIAALKAQHQKPGFAVKLLSAEANSHLGMRGYRVVKDANGEVVKFGKMILGEMPEKYAERRRQAAIDVAKEKIRKVNDGMRDKLAQLQAEANGMGLELVGRGERSPDANGMDRKAGISVERLEAA